MLQKCLEILEKSGNDHKKVLNFPEIAKDLEDRCGLKNQEIADYCRVSPPTISKWKKPEQHNMKPNGLQVEPLLKLTAIQPKFKPTKSEVLKQNKLLDAAITGSVITLVVAFFVFQSMDVHELTGSWNPFSIFSPDHVEVTVTPLRDRDK